MEMFNVVNNYSNWASWLAEQIVCKSVHFLPLVSVVSRNLALSEKLVKFQLYM